MGESARLIEADSLDACTLNGLFALSTVYAIAAESNQAEGVGEVKEDWKCGWKAICDKV